MIYASDLDRTLIYSAKFIDKVSKSEIIPVEHIKDKIISYMTVKSLDLLKEISLKYMFIPVTTRTIEQYLRIDAFCNNDLNKYAITTNGGNILINRELDLEWDNIVKSKLMECEEIDKVTETYKKMIKDKFILKTKVADEKFFYSVVDEEKFEHSSLNQFEEYLKQCGWSQYKQGRKIYFIPNIVTKKNALKYIMEKERINRVIASGDSVLDLCMLEIAVQGFIPSHGELASILKDNIKDYICLTSNKDMKATEEFLYEIQKKLA